MEAHRPVATMEAYQELTIPSSHGPLDARLYDAPGAIAAVIMVGGVGGGFDTPARGLYPRLARSAQRRGVVGLRVKFRDARILGAAVDDVTAALRAILARGIERIALVGHSFGGAVVVAAAVPFAEVVTVVCLASQARGAEAIGALAPRSVFLIHGTDDAVLAPACSSVLYERARSPKRLELLEGSGHLLDEHADEVATLVETWIADALLPPR